MNSRARQAWHLIAFLAAGCQAPVTAQIFQELHAFTDRPDGAVPHGGLVQGSDGNFYGTTVYGGTWGYGTVFRMTTNGEITMLVSLDGVTTDQHPITGLVEASDGNFYCATVEPSRILKVTPTGVVTIYGYGQGTEYDLLRGSDDYLYGVDSGNATLGGFIYRWRPDTGAGDLLFQFDYSSQLQNGYYPSGGLTEGTDGNFYGVTSGGGAYGYGVVYRITTNRTYTVMCSFNRGPGLPGAAYPYGRLLQASDGNFYGIAGSGDGTVFKMTTNGMLTTVAFFDGYAGYYANGGLIEANDGNFYGTALDGGLPANGQGTVFRMTPAGTLSLFVSFTGGYGAYPGASPYAGLAQGSDGNLYGTCGTQGTRGAGNVFRIIMPGPHLDSQPSTLNQLILSWRTNYTGFTLQWSDDLNSSNWIDCTNEVVVSGNKFFVTNSVLTGQRFFRLKRIF